MKTVIHQIVDGYDVVLGFGQAAVDPVALSAKVTPQLATTVEAGACASLSQAINAAALSQAQSTSQAIYNERTAALNALIAKWGPLSAALDARHTALNVALDQDPSVHFTPGSFDSVKEDFLLDPQFATLSAITDAQAVNPQRCMICIDTTLVVDNRGTLYWTQAGGIWTQALITTLGATVPDGATLDAALTADQRTQIAAQAEAARVASLSPDAALAEATAQQQAAKAIVAEVQTEVTAGVSTAAQLASAQAVYAQALEAINAKYGLTLE
jgi:hypothetical protein